MDKEHIKWLRSLAALLNISDKELISKAQLVQPGLDKIDNIRENTYYFLCGTLLAKNNIEVKQ